MKHSFLLVSLCLGLISAKSFGQDTAALSLSQLWEQAFAHYPSLEAYQSQLRQATINQKLTRNQQLPEVVLQAQNTLGTQNTIGGAFFPLPGIYNVNGSGIEQSDDLAANMFGSVVMDWKFLQFGKQQKSMEAAKVLVNQATNQIQVEQLAVQAALSRTYFQLLFHERMELWAEKNTERLLDLFAATKSMALAGLSPGADSLLVKASLKQANAMLHEWQGSKAKNAIALARWVNIVPDQLNIKSGPLLTVAALEAVPTTTNDGLHPHLAYKYEQIAFAEKQKELASISLLPAFSLLGGVQFRGHSRRAENSFYENWGDSYSNTVGNYLVGVGLSWRLSNVFDYKLDRSRFQEEASQRQAEADEVALGLRSQEQMAQRQMAQSRQQVANAEEAYAAASEAYSLFEARYNSGLIAITELLQIQDVLQKTEKTRIEAYYQYWMQQTDWAEAKADFSLLQSVFE